MAIKTSRIASESKSRPARKEPIKVQFPSAKPKQEAPKASTRVSSEELQQRIRERAYYLYLNRGQADGQDCNDWAEAERQIKRELKVR